MKIVHHGLDEGTLKRFWSKVDKSESCWKWTAGKFTLGYGSFFISGSSWCAHRVSFMIDNGPIPEGVDIDHICHNKACVKPAHLRAVTTKQNMENRAGAQSTSKTGIRGVSKNRNRYFARVKHNGTEISGGSYATVEEAERAAVNLRNELFTHNTMDRAPQHR